MSRSLDELRAAAREHARQLEAVRWATVKDLAERWKVSTTTVRKIPRSELPYLTLGASAVRRYDPSDVECYENEHKHGA